MIVVTGEALVDLVIGTDGSVTAKLGGGPYNAARTIGRLGGEVRFMGAVSRDRFGRELLDHLEADGVDTSTVTLTDLPTTLAAAELDESGAASYRFYLEGTSAPSLSAVPEAGRAPDAVHAGTLGLVLRPMADTVLSYLESLPDETLVLLDPNCRPRVVTDRAWYVGVVERAVRRSHVVKISTDDAEYLSPGLDALDYAHSLLHLGARAVLLTAGGDGAHAVTAEGDRLIPSRPVEVVDTIGAGDSFGGAFLQWWLDHHGTGAASIGRLGSLDAVAEAVDAAAEVAGHTCSRAGAEPPRRTDLSPRWHP